ncbi:MAG: amidohydrolase family protein [Desulfocapsaceae bacterium]|nr:amidohydrolase family protein [Desulfocapsaceae bacterium]
MGKSLSAIYSAPWLVPVASPVVRDGAVAVRDGRIEAVGPVAGLRAAFPDHHEIACRGVLMPALINAHIHLELSHLARLNKPAPGEAMCDWIEGLIQARSDCSLAVQQKEQCRRRTLKQLHNSGVVLVADIGNEAQQPSSDCLDSPHILHLLEFLAPTGAAVQAVKNLLADLPDACAATAHAPYSTLPALLSLLKERARRLGSIFSLHVAESADEIEFLRDNTGSFRDFLVRRGAWDGSFSPAGPELAGTVAYLQQLGLLDSRTLCVHCVHVAEEEIRLLAEMKAHVCLCPGSNRFLGVGRAPLQSILDHGLLPAIGTDSAASNECLDIWREMRILREDHPDVAPESILAMATLGGAAALHCQDDFGSLAPHRRAEFLHVDPEGLRTVGSAGELCALLTGGRPRRIGWIGEREASVQINDMRTGF